MKRLNAPVETIGKGGAPHFYVEGRKKPPFSFSLCFQICIFIFFFPKAQPRPDEREAMLGKHALLECVDSQDAGVREAAHRRTFLIRDRRVNAMEQRAPIVLEASLSF